MWSCFYKGNFCLRYADTDPVNSSVKYDLVGKLVEETKLTRKDVIAILCGIKKTVFDQFKDNPEEFIIKAAALINEEKATANYPAHYLCSI